MTTRDEACGTTDSSIDRSQVENGAVNGNATSAISSHAVERENTMRRKLQTICREARSRIFREFLCAGEAARPLQTKTQAWDHRPYTDVRCCSTAARGTGGACPWRGERGDCREVQQRDSAQNVLAKISCHKNVG